jgi:hypothetical protein
MNCVCGKKIQLYINCQATRIFVINNVYYCGEKCFGKAFSKSHSDTENTLLKKMRSLSV